MSKTEELEKSIRNIKDIESKLKNLNDKEIKVELRFFNDRGWSQFSFKPNHKPTENYVFNQIKMSLESDLETEKRNLKKLTSKL